MKELGIIRRMYYRAGLAARRLSSPFGILQVINMRPE